jgi:3-deoxy-D-manno-octulosonate 8-phosphate phosphatase (KDO 8-P phosphatase)
LKEILQRYTRQQVKKARHVKAIFFDVDGVLTNGKIIYDESGKEVKEFNVKDGLIVGYLKKSGIVVGAISGRESEAVTKRCAELKVDFCHQGIMDKGSVCEKLMKHYKLKSRQVAFIGDDINDLPVFKLVGFRICPSDALHYLKTRVDMVTNCKGGGGVLREVADLVLAARGEFTKMLRG